MAEEESHLLHALVCIFDDENVLCCRMDAHSASSVELAGARSLRTHTHTHTVIMQHTARTLHRERGPNNNGSSTRSPAFAAKFTQVTFRHEQT